MPISATSRRIFRWLIANQSRILSLPIFPEMTDEMIRYVSDSIKNFFAAGH